MPAILSAPNILLITSDQHHWMLLGSRTAALHTPNLDRLAAAGAAVERSYCPNPTCSPSRASIITGQYPSWHGCWSLGTKLPEDRTTVGQLLGDAGYDTALIGKAHFQPLGSEPDQTSIECQPLLGDLDHWRGFHGPWYGFDRVELARMHGDESHVGQHYAIWLEERGRADWRRHFRSWPPAPDDQHRWLHWDLPEDDHYSAWTAERTIAAVDRAADHGDPFFCWASFHDPHPPYLAPEPWASMYDPSVVDMPSEPTEDELRAPRRRGCASRRRPRRTSRPTRRPASTSTASCRTATSRATCSGRASRCTTA